MFVKKERFLFFCSFTYLLLSQTLYAQNSTYTVIGVVYEPDNATTIPYVTIQTYAANTTSNPVYSCVSDGMGKFKIVVTHPGDYDIVFSYVGKQTHTSHISLKTETSIDLGTVKLEDQNNELGEVNVYGQKPLVNVLPDKIIYNVSDDPQSFNSNLLKIAEKVPVLNVSREMGILLNDCTPLILVNGRKIKSINNNPVLYLKNTPASNISKIEIISTPGSKYDADESCGVVNIITKKNKEASLMIGSEADSNLGYNMFTDFGFKSNKFIFNGNLAFNSTKKFDSEEYSERVNKTDLQNYQLIQNGETKLVDNDISKTLSIDISYEFDTLNTLNFSAGYFQDNAEDTTFQANTMNDFSKNPRYAYNTAEHSNLKWGNYNMGLNYEYISKNKRNNLVVSALKEVEFVNQLNAQQTLPMLNYSASFLQYKQDEKQDENTLQADFVHNFNDESQLSVGAKTIFRNNSSISNKQYINNTTPGEENENFKNTQLVYALYSEYSFSLAKRYNFSTGLRFESTNIDGGYENSNVNDFSTNYSNLLPYLLISTKTTKGIAFSGSYNAKISRPNISALNPTVYVIDQQTIYYGNPTLTSEYLNTISFNYSNSLRLIKQYAKLSYIFSNNSIQNISGINNDIYFTTYTNEGKYNELKLNLNLSSLLTSRMQVRLGGSGSYISLQHQDVSNSGFSGIVNASTYFILPRDYYIGISGMYKFPTITLQGSGFSFYTCEMNASKAFFGDKLNVELTLSNPFWKTKKYSKTIDTNEMRLTTDKYNMGRKFMISVYYTFNDKDIRASKTSKSIENQDLVGSKGVQ